MTVENKGRAAEASLRDEAEAARAEGKIQDGERPR